MQIGERLRSELDPDQLHKLCVGMDDTLDTMGDRRSIGREEAGVIPPDAAGRGDRARNQEQAGWIGQEARFRKRRPGT